MRWEKSAALIARCDAYARFWHKRSQSASK